jgi:sec-independent protein translocase protein TatC
MPSTKVRPIGYEDRLSIVDHLDELRTRLMICIGAFIVCFSLAYWQNDNILEVVNRPFTESQQQDANNPESEGGDALEQSARFNRSLTAALSAAGLTLKGQQDALEQLGRTDGVPAAAAAQLRESSRALRSALTAIQASARNVPDATPKPVTIGVTEPFVTTFTVSGYAALLLALPLILYQLYAFLLPAFSPQEKKTAVPFMVMVPILFLCGVAFGYFVALPRAVDFLLNFNDDNFDILVGARDYYKFSIVLLLVVGLLFQVPVGVLAITRLGILTPQQLSANRGYIILGVAVIAAVATPTPDPITMLVTMLPLVILFEGSLVLARIFQKRAAGRPSRWDWDDDEEDEDDDGDDGEDDPYGFGEPGPGDPGGALDPDGDDEDELADEDDPDAAALRQELEEQDPTGPRSHHDV